MKYVIDSYAWIEYFMGTKTGEKVKPTIEGQEEKITPTICLAEIYAKTLRVENQELGRKAENLHKRKKRLSAVRRTHRSGISQDTEQTEKGNRRLGISRLHSLRYWANQEGRGSDRRRTLQKTKKRDFHKISQSSNSSRSLLHADES